MATEIKVPALGESVTEATVAKWLKKLGEPVAVDDPVVELETDKVTLEVNATAAGVLSEIRVPEGANVNVGGVLGTIDGAGKAAPAPAAAPSGAFVVFSCPRSRTPDRSGARIEISLGVKPLALRRVAMRTAFASLLAMAYTHDDIECLPFRLLRVDSRGKPRAIAAAATIALC